MSRYFNPPKILGMGIFSFAARVVYAVISGLITIVIFFYLPELLFRNFSEVSTAFSNGDFLYYAVLIALLGGAQIVFRGHFMGDGAGMFAGLAQLYYIYLVTNGGVLTIATSGIVASVDFRTILFLLMAPSALLVVSSVVSACSRVSTQKVSDFEEVVLD
jgi:hypothetical protein